MPPPPIPVALTVAASDSGGGAGIQADLKTFAALGVYGLSVVTAATAQSGRGVRSVHRLPPGAVAAQLEAVLADFAPRVVKTGALVSPESVAAVAEALAGRSELPLVVDPVVAATTGGALGGAETLAALRDLLFGRAHVVTPNVPEAALLLDRGERDVLAAPEDALRELRALGPKAAVLKGGHASGAYSEDLLLHGDDELVRLPARRIASNNTHGTGCTFAAALAAGLAQGESIEAAARGAKAFVTAAIEGSREWRLGPGAGPLHHFWRTWPPATRGE